MNANLAFEARISFLRCFRKGNLSKCWQFPISFCRCVFRFGGVSDKSGALLFLPCSHKDAVGRMSNFGLPLFAPIPCRPFWEVAS